mmetsp:Transcript_13332/g.19982  ORF Transcript_13332/g.19982 Transcript_13332/m.19982 type:complete len:137 (-) Transcript_13332:554-964(-)
MATTTSADDDIETWRDVHRHLTLAIIQSRDNVAAELAKRRHLLEEINRSPAGGPPSSTSSSGQGNLPASKKVPKKASAGKLNKNTLASVKSVKQAKQHSMTYPPNVAALPMPVGIINNLLPTQKKQVPMAPPPPHS